jgi:circadian clock protein KaiC
MLTRLVDFLKTRQSTAVFTSLTAAGSPLEGTETAVSSLMDTWLLLESIQVGGERNRTFSVLKSRGMTHSNQIREFLLTGNGVKLPDVYLGPEGVLTGSARLSQEARESATGIARVREMEHHRRELERKRQIFEARMAMLRAEFETEEENIRHNISEAQLIEETLLQDRTLMLRSRKADTSSNRKDGRAQAARVR